MDVQLQELIDKIKKDGVASAELNAQKIIEDAQKKATLIISEAEAKADNIIKSAKVETERMEKASEDAVAQAGRNLIISFRDGINKELSAIISSETEKAYDKDLLKKLIPETVKAWAANTDSEDLSVLLNPKDLKALEASFKTALKSQISKGLLIKGDSSVTSGFRIGAKDGSVFYDFSAEEVASLFSAYLNPKVTEIMKKAALSISDSEKTDSKSEVKEEKLVEKVQKVSAKKTATKSSSDAEKSTAKTKSVSKTAEKAPAKKGKK